MNLLPNPFGSGPRRDQDQKLEFVIELLGRPKAGKSTWVKSLHRGPLQEMLPASGCYLTYSEPRLAAEGVQTTRETERHLQHKIHPETRDTKLYSYYLKYQGEELLKLSIRDAIGQVLNTTPSSPPAFQNNYQEAARNNGKADVLCLMIPCPITSAKTHQEQFREDTLHCFHFAEFALKTRSAPHPVSLAVVVTRIDTRYQSEEEARSQMPKEVLRWLGTRTQLTFGGHAKVGDIALFPVSSMGFNSCLIRQPAVKTAPVEHLTGGAEWEDRLEPPEPEWILKAGGHLRPFNTTPLVVWSMLRGMKFREDKTKSDKEHPLAWVIRGLDKDLEMLNGWYLPIKNQ